MKIIYFAMDPSNYGWKSSEILVAEEIAKEGHEVTIVSETIPYGYEKELPNNIKFVKVKSLSGSTGGLSSFEISLLTTEDYDICFATSVSGASISNYIAYLTNAYSVCQLLDVPVWRLKYKHYRDHWSECFNALEECDKVIINVPQTGEILSAFRDGRLTSKLSLVYYGIPNSNADLVPDQEKKNQIIFVSALRWYKGLDIAMFALSMVNKENRPKLIVIGEGDKTEYEIPNGIPMRYLDIASQLDIDVEFRGWVNESEKFKAIKESKLGILPDYTKVISSLFPIEAAYCGVPCIVGNFPINRDKFEQFPIFIEEPFNTKMWATTIEESLKNLKKLEVHTFKFKDWIKIARSNYSHAMGLIQRFNQLILNSEESKESQEVRE